MIMINLRPLLLSLSLVGKVVSLRSYCAYWARRVITSSSYSSRDVAVRVLEP
jgi:hypothetical protein